MISVEESIPTIKRIVRKTMLAYAHKTSILMVKEVQGANQLVYNVKVICGSCSNTYQIRATIVTNREQIYLNFEDFDSSTILWTQEYILGTKQIIIPNEKKKMCPRLSSLL